MVDDDVGAVLPHRGEAFVGAAAADDLQPARVRELDGGKADAARRAVNENGLARLRIRAVKERAVRRAVRDAERRALCERRARRQTMEL